MAKTAKAYSQWRQEKLTDPARATRYLNAAYRESRKEGSREAFLYAVKNVIQANQVTKIAKEVGVTRESVYRSFSAEGNPAFYTIDAVLEKLDIEIGFNPIGKTAVQQPPSPAIERERTTAHVKRRRRTVAHRSNRSYSADSAQLKFTFIEENANNAGKTTSLSQPGLARLSSIKWVIPVQEATERTSMEFNAMLANIENSKTQSSINELARGRA